MTRLNLMTPSIRGIKKKHPAAHCGLPVIFCPAAPFCAAGRFQLCQQILRAAERGVQPVLLQQLCVRAALGDAAVGDDDDLPGRADGGQAVRDDERGAVFCQLVECVLDLRFRQRVKRAGRLVQNEDGRIFEEGKTFFSPKSFTTVNELAKIL